MTAHLTIRMTRRLLLLGAAIVLLLMLWQGAIIVFKVPPYIVPSPIAVGEAVRANIDLLATASVVTLSSALLGLFVSCSLAITLAILFVSYQGVARSAMPFVIVFRSAPVTAIAPLIMLFVGRGLATSIVVVVIVSFFPVMVNMMRGLLSADRNALELMHVYGASRSQSIRYVQAPYALPFLFTGLRVSSASAVLGAMLSEWVTGSPGLGFLILDSSVMREIEMMWAAIIASVIFALIIFTLTSAAERTVLHWKPEQA